MLRWLQVRQGGQRVLSISYATQVYVHCRIL
jgi:hypothetical protein